MSWWQEARDSGDWSTGGGAFRPDVATLASLDGGRNPGGRMRLPVLLVSVLVLPARLGGGGGAAPDDRTAIACPTRGGVPAWKVRTIWRRGERALALDLGASSTPSPGGAPRAAIGLPEARPCPPASDRFRDA